MNFLIIIFAFIGLSAASPTRLEHYETMFENFKRTYNKEYFSPEEEQARFRIFSENVKNIEHFNSNDASNLGYTLGINHFADIHDAELRHFKGLRMPSIDSLGKKLPNKGAEYFYHKVMSQDIEVPEEIDWRLKSGRVSSVKNQGECGSCWSFATTGVLEGQELVSYAQAYFNGSQLTELSEQNIIDCSNSEYLRGCEGGLMLPALQAITEFGGLESENDYPYETKKSYCRADKHKIVMTNVDGYMVFNTSETNLKELVAKYGPVAVGIDASDRNLVRYKNGVYYNPLCSHTLDHAVLIVGYGVDPRQGDYWLVKNSWSHQWGENGYIKMARNKNNHCGIALIPTIATF